MMASTPPPPPPRRIHTPPTPLHGPKYDSYEPYSPRRSTRVAAQVSKTTPSPRFGSSPLKQAARASTPPSTIKNNRTRASNQTFSPPSSPSSPPKHVSIISPKKRARTSKLGKSSPLPASDSDTDILPEKEVHRHRRTSSKESFGMLNTPAKTPKRRKDPNLTGAARLLFGDNEGILQPTPRRNKKAYDPFAILADDAQVESSKIEIFTDMKDRVPTVDEDESNPFLSRNAAGPGARAKAKRKSAQDFEVTRHQEGMTYVFRGKKIFRKYAETNGHDADEEGEGDEASDMDIKHRAGAAASKPLLRSSIKPRLLFPSAQQISAKEREEAEEALTDRDVPESASNAKVITPTKRSFQTATPPTTVKGRRKVDLVDGQCDVEEEAATSQAAVPAAKKKRSLFDGYARRKAGVKREGDVLEGEVGKRTRSGNHS